jgi:SNF2 family DNA or RNA helicase
MQIINDTALKVRLPKSVEVEVLAKIPKSQLHPDGDTLVYWDYSETEWLAYFIDMYIPKHNIGQVPSPMLRDYKWPGIHAPFDHQKQTASYLSIRSRAFCFNEAGTGKTSAAIWAADYLMNLGLVKRVLVICPLSIMYTAWQAEVFKTAMHRTAGVAYGNVERRRKIIESTYEFVIINYDGVALVADAIKHEAFDLVIVDEANAYKNTSTKRWKTISKLLSPSTRLWMMTGTPASQSPIDAFGLARLVSPHRVPKFKTAWQDKVMQQVTRFKWVPKNTARDDVFFALQPAIRYTKKECLDLPDVIYETRDVPLSPQVANYYKKLKTQMMIEAAGEQISAVNAAASMNKLLQISGGAVYTDKRDIVEFDVSPRLAVLQEVLDECSNKIIVFVPYLHTIEVITKHLDANGYSNAVIKGDVSPRARAYIIDAFQRERDPQVLVIQPQAASHGVTLTAADTIIFWSPVLSVETFIQCVGRIDRVGQVNKALVVMLQGSDAERKVYAGLHSRVDSHLQLTDLYKQVIED